MRGWCRLTVSCPACLVQWGASSYTSLVLPWASLSLPSSQQLTADQTSRRRMCIYLSTVSLLTWSQWFDSVYWAKSKAPSGEPFYVAIILRDSGPLRCSSMNECLCLFQGILLQMFLKYGWWIRERYLLSRERTGFQHQLSFWVQVSLQCQNICSSIWCMPKQLHGLPRWVM